MVGEPAADGGTTHPTPQGTDSRVFGVVGHSLGPSVRCGRSAVSFGEFGRRLILFVLCGGCDGGLASVLVFVALGFSHGYPASR